MIYVGVDLGTKGGIVAVDESESIVFAEVMPVIETVKQARKKIRSKMVKTAYGMVCAKFPLIVYKSDGSQYEAKLKLVNGSHCAVSGKGKTKQVIPLQQPVEGVVSIGQVSKKTEIRDVVHHFPNFQRIHDVLNDLSNVCGLDMRVCIEGAFTNGSLMMTNMHTIAVMNQYHGALVFAFTGMNQKPYVISPRDWQKMYWQHIPEDTKKESIETCKKTFPEWADQLTQVDERGKVYMHDGLCDAALIALYCKRNNV